MHLATKPIANARVAGAGAVVALAMGVLAVVALRTVHAVPELGYVGWSPSGAAVLLVPGLAAIVVALESLYRQRSDR
jgi:hypothetical protein